MNEKIIRAYTLKNAIEHNGNAVVSSVISGLFNHGLKKNEVKKIIPKINKILKEINSLELEEQKILFGKYKNLIGHREERVGLPEIPIKKVISRFAPSPSGSLHIGHILTLCPNFLYAKKTNGKFYLRIEDTNPDNIYKKAYKMIEKGGKWLTKNNCEIIIQSNRMNIYYKYIEKLLKNNSVYVCDCDKEEFKKLLLKKKSCLCRDLNKDEQLKRWKKMLDKNGYKQGEAVLRFKSDLNHKNPAMRDFPLARINETKHPIQGNKYKVWPLMNLSVSVDDIEFKTNFIIRGKDHKDNAKRQEMIFNSLNKKYPYCVFIGRIHFNDLIMSSTKMRQDIEKGKYSGWDDERLLTLDSLKKKYKQEVFYEFVEQRGLSEADKIISKKDFLKVLEDIKKRLEK